MDYKEYQKNHFGEPVNIYNAEGQLVYIGITPIGKNSKMKKFEGKDNFSFDVNGNGATVEVPATSIFKLTSEDDIEVEDTI